MVTETDLAVALTPLVESGRVPGLVALVARGDDVAQVVLGSRSVGGEPMTPDTVFRIASITKPITAVATLVLVDDGLIELDDPVDELLPELADPVVLRNPAGPMDDVVPADRPITVRDLLCFTGGLGFPADFELAVVQRLVTELGQGPPEPQRVPAPDDWMRSLGTIPLLHQPGQGWTYNLQSDLLGVLIARASGRSFPEFLAARVFDPLGMVDTGFAFRADQLSRAATAYRPTEDGSVSLWDRPDGQWSSVPAFPSGSGGLVSTAADWLAFGRMLLAVGVSADGSRVLSSELVTELLTDHTTAAIRDYGSVFLRGQGWGFGGSVDIAASERWNVPGRYGWVGGTGTVGYVIPATDTVTVLLTQVAMDSPTSFEVLAVFLAAAAG